MQISKLLAAVVAILLASLCVAVLFLLVKEARHARSIRQRTNREQSSSVL